MEQQTITEICEILEEYASQNGLEIVETTEGMNGYPQNLKKVITDFQCFEDAEICADTVGGHICLISRRDGHQLWKNNGRAYEPIEINDSWFGDDDVVIRPGSASEWWKDEYQHLKDTLLADVGDCPSPDEIIEIIKVFQEHSKVYDMIENLDENEQVYYERGYPQNAEVVPIKTLRYHDFDVHEYAIAVVIDESDPGFWKTKERKPSEFPPP